MWYSFFRTFLLQLSSGHLEKGKSNHSFYANVLRKESMKMKTRKTIRKIVSLVLAVIMMASAFAFTANATENNSQSLSEIFAKSFAQATAVPTPENPLTYSYKAQFTARDVIGRVVNSTGRTGSATNESYFLVHFYLSKEAYDQGAEPVYSDFATFEGNGQYSLTYSDTFSQKPPATLYWVVEPYADVYFSPSHGTASAQLEV